MTLTNAEEDVQDIVHIVRRKVGGKRILVNVSSAHRDNISFHYETSVQKWTHVFQRRIVGEKELGKEALDCKEIMELLKAAGLMKIVTDDGPCYENLVKEFIVNITIECNVECNKEYRNMYHIGKCVKFLLSIINGYLGISKSAGSNKVFSIDKITSKKKEAGGEEEEETTGEDEEKHYVETLK